MTAGILPIRLLFLSVSGWVHRQQPEAIVTALIGDSIVGAKQGRVVSRERLGGALRY
jgi:hypothetical protein